MIPKVREKRKPHYELSRFKTLFQSEDTRFITKQAHKGAVSQGYMAIEDIEGVIDKLCPHHFYKSMTTYENYKVWQDVYKLTDEEKRLYIKIQFSVDEPKKAILIQMKKDEGSDE
ncbi:MAG: type II toxin-antitoxin system MqsR family toxin [Deltaproteobacteria bacterium]|nr:type II toxin-antitoxin system MqsR family toxin [Deltaproteobacteria bacterium]